MQDIINLNGMEGGRILYLVPGVGLPPEELERRRQILNSFTSTGFMVDVEAVKEGPASIESYCDEYVCIPDTLRHAINAEKRGYDAIIIGCFGDPGIEAVREALRIPVIGPGETSFHIAAMLGYQFSVISILKNIVNPLKVLAKKLGLKEQLMSIRVINKPVLSLAENIEETKRALIIEGRKAVEEDDADTLILGCMSEAFLGFAEHMKEELGVPVVNPVGVSVKMAELMLMNRLSHSKKAYPFPPKTIYIKTSK
jgi:allantoin racemase